MLKRSKVFAEVKYHVEFYIWLDQHILTLSWPNLKVLEPADDINVIINN